MAAQNGPLSGRTAVITGASAGIGEAIARDLAANGCRVVLNARRADRLRSVADDIDRACAGQVCTCCPGDASDAATIGALLDAAGEPDIAIVNAGRGLRGSVTDSDTSQWEEMVRTNLIGAALFMREAAKRMGGGADGAPADWQSRPRDIVVIGSNVGRHISPFSSMYGSTKFAVHSLAEALRREMAPKGVRVTLVEPGVVKSEFQEVAGYDPVGFGEFMERIGPVLAPEDVARAVTFAVSQPAAVHVGDILIRPTRQEYP